MLAIGISTGIQFVGGTSDVTPTTPLTVDMDTITVDSDIISADATIQ